MNKESLEKSFEKVYTECRLAEPPIGGSGSPLDPWHFEPCWFFAEKLTSPTYGRCIF